MIVAFSTSSPQASVAIFGDDHSKQWAGEEIAPQAASGACMRLLENGLAQVGASLADVTLFLADLGPGSFTGVRVGVTLAKTLAFSVRAKAGGVSAFDLIDANRVVVLPSKRGELFVREPGRQPYRTAEAIPHPLLGYGSGVPDEAATYPHAAGFVRLIEQIERVKPEMLVPGYLIEPSISTPKKPYGAGIAG